MSSSLRYFTVTSNATVAAPTVFDSANVRLGDTLPLAFALNFVAEGDPIPNGGGAVAGPGGDFVINTDFLPAGDLLSAFARSSLSADTPLTILEGDDSATAPIPFDNDQFLKRMTSVGTGAFTADQAGVYRVNTTLNAVDVPNGYDITVAVAANTLATPAVYTPVPQGTFTIVGCPTIETLNKDTFTIALAAGQGIHIDATIQSSVPVGGGARPVRPVGSLPAGFEFNMGADSVIEIDYLGTETI